ncbi:hypothetical protein HDN1F_37860 [gamma proteobacterium HdN1]|nr:hypothetical protein HDN1F_37860 [gamma proteobacterium HdN1]
MKKHVAIALVLAAAGLAGCASNSELSDVRAQIEQAQQTADRALSAAESAQQRADSAVSTANAASAKADAAQATANQVDEKIDRMFKKTMMK